MYFIGDMKDKFTPEIVLGSGCEGKVYYNEKTQEAVKVHFSENNSKYKSLDEKDASSLCNLPTENILLPRRIVYDENGLYKGYTTTYIPTSRYIDDIDVERYKIKDLIKILSKLYKDVQVISNNGLCLSDLCSDGNYIFNGLYYLIDPGLYYFSDKDLKEILKENIKRLNIFINYTIMWNRIEGLQEQLLERGSNYTMCDYLCDEGMQEETLISLIRRKVK